MKALVTQIIRYNGEYYRLRKGEKIPKMPEQLKESLQDMKLIEGPKKKESRKGDK